MDPIFAEPARLTIWIIVVLAVAVAMEKNRNGE